jgi:hypothetical protein
MPFLGSREPGRNNIHIRLASSGLLECIIFNIKPNIQYIYFFYGSLWHTLLIIKHDYICRYLVTGNSSRGYPGWLFEGYRRMQNLMVNAETTIYTGSVRRNNIGVPTSSLGWIVCYALRSGFWSWGLRYWKVMRCLSRELCSPSYSPGDRSHSRL